MTIEAELPDGRILEFPDGTPTSVVQATVRRMLGGASAPERKTERTMGEAVTDVGAGIVSGVGNVVQLPGQLYGLATGDFSETGLLGLGKRIESAGQEMKSEGLKGREARRQEAVRAASEQGQWEAFKTSFLGTVKDPALLSSFIAEQLPQLIPIIASGGIGAAAAAGRATAAQLAKGATKEVAAQAARAAAVKAGTTAAIQTGAVMQGTDVGAGTYDAIYQNVLQRGGTQEQAADAALNRARAAGVASYGLSVLANRYLYGGAALERALVGGATGKGMLAAGAAGAFKEIPSENIEEVGGALARNVALQSVDPTQSLTQGLGETAAQATIGAAALGGAAGAYSGRGAPPAPTAPVQPSTTPPALPVEDTFIEDDDDPNAPVDLSKVASLQEMAQKLKDAGRTAEAKELVDAAKALQAKAAKQASAQAVASANQKAQAVLQQVDLMDYPTLAKARAELAAGPQTADAKAAVKVLAGRTLAMDTQRIEAQRRGDALAAESTLAQEPADLFGMSYPPAPEAAPVEEVAPSPIEGQDPRQIGLFEAEQARRSAFAKAQPDLYGNVYPPAKASPAAPEAPVPARPSLRADALQMPLDLRAQKPPRVTVPAAEAPLPQGAPDVIPAAEPARRVPDRRVRSRAAPVAPSVDTGVGAPVELAGEPDVPAAPGPVAIDRSGVAPVQDDAAGEPSFEGALPAAVVTLEASQTRVQAEAALDELVAVQQDPEHPDHDGVANFIARSMRVPGFETALSAAEGRARQRRKTAEQDIRQAVQGVRTAEEQDVFEAPASAPEQLFDVPPGYEAATEREAARRETTELEARRKEAWAQVPEVQRAKSAQGTLFRTPEGQPVPKQPIGDAELRRTVAAITKALGIPSDGVTIMNSVTQLDPEEKAGTRAGGMRDGRVYLFRDGIANNVEGHKTIFHELLHQGLHNLLPMSEYVATMVRLAKQFPALQTAAREWLQDPQNRKDVAKYPSEMRGAIAVEESLAKLAEGRLLPSGVRKLGNWFANLASRMGLKRLARAIRTMEMTELEAFVDDALRAAGSAPVAAPTTQTSAPTKFRKAPTPSATARDADRLLTQLNMQPAPARSRVQEAATALKDAVDNPRATAQDLHKATATMVDKFRTMYFSSNAGFDAAVRRAIGEAFAADPAKMGLLLSISDAQVDGSSVLAGLFAREGNLKYDPKLYKWQAEEATSMADIARTISGMAETHGLTKEKASQIVDSYFEARRTEALQKQNDENIMVADALEAAGDKKNAKKFRDRVVQHLKDAAWVADAMQFGQMFPELATVAGQWNEVRANTAKIMVDSGLWTAEESETMLSAAEYVPFYREEQLESGKGPKDYISGLRVAAKEKRLRGSERAVNDIFDNMMKWTQYAIERSVRNHMALQRADAAVELGLAEEVDTGSTKGSPVTIWRGGVQRTYNMADPLFMDSFAGLESVALPALKGWAKIANVFRQSVVLNPLFGILQVPQDAVAAIYTSGLKPRYAFSVPARAVKEFLQTLLAPEKSAVHKELRAFGAVGARDTTAEVVKMDLELMEGARSEAGIPTQLWRRISKVLHHVAMASDSAVRQAVYTAAMDQGMSQAEALEKAFQLINFRNRGTSKGLAVVARVVPFLNAYMAAQNVAYKTLSGTGISPTDRRAALQTLGATTLGMMGLSAIYAMAMGGDEGYEKIPLYKRDRVFVIPGTGGVSIPIRADVFSFPKVIAEHMWHHITDSGTLDGANTRRSMTDLLASSFVGPIAPQPLKPAIEVMTNYDFFRQRPLVGANLSKAETQYQATDSTSELGRLLSKSGIGSPITWDHLMRGYLGSLGGTIMYASNALASSLNGVPRPDMSLWDAIASFPGAASVMPKQSDSALRQDFYELKEAVDRVTQTISYLNNRDPDALDAYLDNEDVMARDWLSAEVDAVYREMAAIRKEMSLVRNDRDLTAEEKRIEIEALQQEETDLLSTMDIKALRAEARL